MLKAHTLKSEMFAWNHNYWLGWDASAVKGQVSENRWLGLFRFLFYHDLDLLDEVVLSCDGLHHRLLDGVVLLHVHLRVQIKLLQVVHGGVVVGVVVGRIVVFG